VSLDRSNDFWEQSSRSEKELLLLEGNGLAESSASVPDSFLMTTWICKKTFLITEAAPFVKDFFPAEQ
jgi:hypothetical protein